MHLGLRRLMAFLAQYQLPPVLAMSCASSTARARWTAVRRNPYLLSGDVCGVDFSVTDPSP
jgi:exodeoxyribonuclease V alpha subunit